MGHGKGAGSVQHCAEARALTSDETATIADPLYELHNLTADPEERHNLVAGAPDALGQLRTILGTERDVKRLLPRHRNPAS